MKTLEQLFEEMKAAQAAAWAAHDAYEKAKQSKNSIDWLYANLKSHFEHDGDLLEGVQMSFDRAKAMHKSEIIWAHGIKMKGVNNDKCVTGEQYYNEKFGGNNEETKNT